ncbi:MAG: RNA methyltransferase [Acidovorax sp.]|uniref:RNA methyltransferase n=1 Tax=Acidovorax sp. TaxID=1872122 RepID=UPI002607F7E6|nr:RNA methyltransferase [Acidovorax sp.]MDH4416484.1 RNA methyltransferase [Acidovorax sp.]
MTRFVLIQTSHPGNVGATARAMKVMGFSELVLVRPRFADVLSQEDTVAMASGAADILARARIVDSLDEALDGVSFACATAMTPRDFGPPTAAPRAHFEMLLNKEQSRHDGCAGEPKNALNPEASEPGADRQAGVAFLFGSERFGMTNEDVYRCHVALSIPTNPGFGSLNLGAAIQVIAYEWRQALGGFAVQDTTPARALADAAQVAGMLGHWEQALTSIGFLDPTAPKKLMPRLNQLFNRAQLSPEEIHILRGVAKAMIETAQAKR